MNEEKHNNSELEAFFKNRLNSTSSESEGWDTPPDQVLENAFSVLDEKKRKRFGFFWIWSGIGLAVITFISFLIWNTNRLNKIDSKLSTLIENTQAQLENEKQLEKESITDKIESNNSLSKPETNLTESNYYKLNRSTQTVEKSKPIQQDKAIKASTSLLDTPTIQHEVNKIITIHESNKHEFDAYSRQVQNEPSTLFEQDTTKTSVSLPFVQAEIVKGEDNVNESISFNNQVYFFAGANVSSLSMTALKPLPNNLTEYDNWYAGYQLGIGLRRKIKPLNWSVSFGLKYQRYRNNSVFKSKDSYIKSNEGVNASGNPIYQTQIGFESPIYKYEDALQININNRNIQDGSQLNNSTEISNTFHVTAATIGLNYSVYSNTNWNFQTHLGVEVNHVVEMHQEMDFEMKNDNQVLTTQSFDESTTKQMTTLYSTAIIGIDVNRSIGNRMFVGLSTSYAKSLQSIRKVEGSDQVKTQVSLIQTSIAIGHKF